MDSPQQHPGQRPSERIWTVQCFFRTADGEVLPDDQAVTNAFLEARAIQMRLGGVMSIGAKRVDTPAGTVTTELLFRWQSFAPKAPADEEPLPAAEAPVPSAAAAPVPAESNGHGELEPCTVCGRKDPAERPDDPPCQCQVQAAGEKPTESASKTG